MKTSFYTTSLIIAIATIATGSVLAWNPPPTSAPNSNQEAPLNTGSGNQKKLGPFYVGGTPTYKILGYGNSFALQNLANVIKLILGQDGNMGLGTLAPGANLEVAGQVKISGGSPELGKVLVSNADGLASWQFTPNLLPATALANQTMYFKDTGWKADNFLTNTGSRIGIGTSAPTARLEVYEENPLSQTLFSVESGDPNSYYPSATGKIALRTSNVTGRVAAPIELIGGNSCGASSVGGSINLIAGSESPNCAGEKGGSINISGGNGNVSAGMAHYCYGDPWELGGSIILTPGNGAVPGQIVLNNKVGLGTNTPDVELDVSGDIEGSLTSTGSTVAVYAVAGGTNGGRYKLVRFSSSKRYKDNITDLDMGLETLNKLRPVEFTWKSTGERDFGFIAEEAEAVNPKLVTYADGQVESFRYAQLGAILTNAVKEHQKRIDNLKKELTLLDQEIDLLKHKLKRPVF